MTVTNVASRPILVKEHLANQMLPASKKHIGNLRLILDDTSQGPFHEIATIIKDALELVEDDHHSSLALAGDDGGS